MTPFSFHEFKKSVHAQSCPTFCDPMDWNPLGSSVHAISQARILDWVAISSTRGSSQPRDQTHISCVSCITGRFFTWWAIREALYIFILPVEPDSYQPRSISWARSDSEDTWPRHLQGPQDSSGPPVPLTVLGLTSTSESWALSPEAATHLSQRRRKGLVWSGVFPQVGHNRNIYYQIYFGNTGFEFCIFTLLLLTVLFSVYWTEITFFKNHQALKNKKMIASIEN